MKKLLHLTMTAVGTLAALPAAADLADPLTPVALVTEDPDTIVIVGIALGLFGLLYISGLALVAIIVIILYRRNRRVHKPHP